jgi:DnaJ family protein C protein 2
MDPSCVFDSFSCCCCPAPAEQLGINLTPWTADEQRLLEQALKTYPASLSDRWERIAEAIPNRSKKECMKRYKVLFVF